MHYISAFGFIFHLKQVKDYLCTALVVLSSIVLAVNLALSLGSGPIVCFLTEGLFET